jgi:hypothetical protein
MKSSGRKSRIKEEEEELRIKIEIAKEKACMMHARAQDRDSAKHYTEGRGAGHDQDNKGRPHGRGRIGRSLLSQEEAGEAQRAEVDDVKMTSTGAARETVNKEEKFDFDSDIDIFGRVTRGAWEGEGSTRRVPEPNMARGLTEQYGVARVNLASCFIPDHAAKSCHLSRAYLIRDHL